jgi:hypothetical protein
MGQAITNEINEHMDVIASDGENVGKVDEFKDGRIKLTKASSPDGEHHFVPLKWVDHVGGQVHLNKTLAQIRASHFSDAVPKAQIRDATP